MAATTISRATLTDSTSPTTGDPWNAALVGTALYDKIDALFTAALRIERSSAGDIDFTVAGASNTAGSDAQLRALVAGVSAGDPFATFTVTSGSSWSVGADNDDGDSFKISLGTALGTNEFVLTIGGMALLGDNANADMTVGLTINQGANDNEILAFKSSDVTHGVTTLAETDTYGSLRKALGGSGGLEIRGFADTGLTHSTIFLRATQVDAAQTTKAITSQGVVRIRSSIASGTAETTVGADGNLLTVENSGTTRFILDADGDSHQDVGTAWTNFDDHDDLELLDALAAGVSRKGDPLRQAFGRLLTKHRRTLTAARIVTFNRDGHHFINWSRAHMLTIGAVRQLGMRQRALETRLRALEAA